MIQNINKLGQGAAYRLEWNGLHSLLKSITEIIMKLKIEGGFSSKLRVECLIEFGNEACTHRPSPSSSILSHLPI